MTLFPRPCLKQLQIRIQYFIIDFSSAFINKIDTDIQKNDIKGKADRDRAIPVKPVTQIRDAGIDHRTDPDA